MQILCPSTNSYETCASSNNLLNADAIPNPYTKPDLNSSPNSPVAETCLKIKGHLVSFREVNCPVPHSIIIIRGDIIHSNVYLFSTRRESKEYHTSQLFKLVHFLAIWTSVTVRKIFFNTLALGGRVFGRRFRS